MRMLYELVMRLAVIAVLDCVLGFLLPAGALRRSARRGIDLIMLLLVAEAVFGAVEGVL
ncbi:MAG: hypothetical protein LBN26_06185 [Christensenellaceae bacterium]|jgi:hypothetical protein|nr:hypothetical protein [Christensenellaceae bacterium]